MKRKIKRVLLVFMAVLTLSNSILISYTPKQVKAAEVVVPVVAKILPWVVASLAAMAGYSYIDYNDLTISDFYDDILKFNDKYGWQDSYEISPELYQNVIDVAQNPDQYGDCVIPRTGDSWIDVVFPKDNDGHIYDGYNDYINNFDIDKALDRLKNGGGGGHQEDPEDPNGFKNFLKKIGSLLGIGSIGSTVGGAYYQEYLDLYDGDYASAEAKQAAIDAYWDNYVKHASHQGTTNILFTYSYHFTDGGYYRVNVRKDVSSRSRIVVGREDNGYVTFYEYGINSNDGSYVHFFSSDCTSIIIYSPFNGYEENVDSLEYWAYGNTSFAQENLATNIPIFKTWDDVNGYANGTVDISKSENYVAEDEQKDVNAVRSEFENYYDTRSRINTNIGYVNDLYRQNDFDSTAKYESYKDILKILQDAVNKLNNSSTDADIQKAVENSINENIQKNVNDVNRVIGLPTFSETPSIPSTPTDPSIDNPYDIGTNPNTGGSGNIPSVLTTIFPFCIPFDLIYLMKVLSAKPAIPVFEANLPFPDPIGEQIISIDFTNLEPLANIFRTFQIILFILGLILITRNIIRG